MARNMRRGTAALAVVALAFGVAACGDDDDGGEGATETTGSAGGAEGAPAAFCDAFVEFNSAVFQVDISEDTPEAELKEAGESLSPSSQAIEDNAPDDLAERAAEINSAIQDLRDGDATAFNGDALFESYTSLAGGTVEACEFDAVDVTASDYRFDGLPATLEAGTVAFKLTNSSTAEPHEIALIRRPDGETRTFAELLALPEDQAQAATEFKGAGFAEPQGEGAAIVELEPGSYIAVCFIPVGGGEEPADEGSDPAEGESEDDEDAPAHWEQGMVTEFTVE